MAYMAEGPVLLRRKKKEEEVIYGHGSGAVRRAESHGTGRRAAWTKGQC